MCTGEGVSWDGEGDVGVKLGGEGVTGFSKKCTCVSERRDGGGGGDGRHCVGGIHVRP